MPSETPQSFPGMLERLKRHVTELVRLAGPVVVTRAGIMAMALVDTIMVGRYATRDLADLSIAMAVFAPVMVTLMGMMTGTIVVAANAFGRGEFSQCGAAWRRSLPYAAGLGIFGAVISFFGGTMLGFTSLDEGLVERGSAVLRVLGVGLFPTVLFLASNFFLEGVKRPKPAMFITIAANLLNIGLNWVFIYGHWGFPALGALGSALATSGVRTFMAVGILLYIWNMGDHARFAVRVRPKGGWKAWAHQRRLGYAGAVAIGAEVFAFGVINVMAGHLGTLALAAYSIGHNIFAIAFMIALGFGIATGVRVGIAHGRRDYSDLALAGWTGLGVNALVMAAAGVFIYLLPAAIVGVYTKDTELIAFFVPIMATVAVIPLMDGGVIVIAQALRGRGETWAPMTIFVGSYFGVMAPLSWYLAFELGRGAQGLFEGIFLGSAFVLALLALRFHWLTVRDRR